MPDDENTASRDPRLYTLSNQQFEYLLNGETGDRDPADLEEEIQATVDNLKDRLQHLAEDLALFHHHGLLESGDQTEAWEELTSIQRRDGLYYRPSDRSWMMEETRDVGDRFEYIQPAVHLGHVTRFLYQNANPPFDEPLIGMGLLLGLNGGFLRENPSDPQHAFYKQGDDTLKTIEDLFEAFDAYFQRQPMAAVETEGLRERLEAIDLTLTDSLLKEADSRAVNREYPPVPSYLDSLAEQLEADSELQAIETLANQIQEDIQTLTEFRYIDAYGVDIIHGLFIEEKFGKKGAIAEHADTEEHQVAKLLNDLQGREPPWSARPLVQEEPESGYSPTGYGHLVGAVISNYSRAGEEQRVVESNAEHQDIVRLLHRYHFAGGLDGHAHLQSVLREQFELDEQEQDGEAS